MYHGDAISRVVLVAACGQLHHPSVLPPCSLPEAKEGLMAGASLVLPPRSMHPCNPPRQLPLPCFSCIPQPRLLPVGFIKAPSLFHLLERLPKARAGTATVAFKGYTSRIIFITIFIQCLSRRCTDPLQWRKKRTQNLFSKDIQIS